MSLSRLIINGLKRLNGSAKVQGSKNSSLPILSAAVLCRGESIIHNCPDLSDVRASINILRFIGCKVSFSGGTLVCDSSSIRSCYIPDLLMREMRSSILFLGALLGRLGKAEMCLPGGCEIGTRPIDLHLKALEELGVEIRDDHGVFHCTAPNGLCGGKIALSFPSVGATENAMICACLAEGTTVISNAAREPEIVDLADFLNSCGANVYGAGDDTIMIDGVSRLHGAVHTIIPDRIAAATWMSCAAVTSGRVILRDVIPAHLAAVTALFENCGCTVTSSGNTMSVNCPYRLAAPGVVRTMPYPGFPTDAQAPIMSMAAVSKGTSLFIENIFENRYHHVNGLLRMGANIKVEGRAAVIQGVPLLHGAQVSAHDLRGAAALITAGLAAEGVTAISGLQYLDRGYEDPEEVLSELGADVKRV